MTIQELIKILDEKIENAEQSRHNAFIMFGKGLLFREYYAKVEAYTDIKNLLENEVLEDER